MVIYVDYIAGILAEQHLTEPESASPPNPLFTIL